MAKQQTSQYRYVGSHADVLPGGRPVEPGEFIDLSEDNLQEAHYKMLFDDGKIIAVEDAKSKTRGEEG